MKLRKANFPKQELNREFTQITTNDSRFYEDGQKTYPSVTYVLSYFPKGKHFEECLKRVGYNADFIAKKAAGEGTLAHDLCEQYLLGKEINLMKDGSPQYDLHVWKMFLRFVDFWEEYNPKLIETEVHLFSDEIKVAGTCDMVCEIDGELWIIDFKTSNHLQTTYDLQTAIYGKCYEECYGKKADRYGVLWLKSSKRGPKDGAMQGKGWEMYESKRTQEENIDIFNTVKKLFDLENPRHKPVFTEFRTQAKRKL